MRTRYDAAWSVAYQDDGDTKGHRLLQDGCVVVEDDRVVFVGKTYDGDVDATVRTNDVIAPGYVSTHAHLGESPVDKSLGEDSDRRQFWSTSLVDILPPKGMALDEEGARACIEYSIPELLLGGCTTVLQLGASPSTSPPRPTGTASAPTSATATSPAAGSPATAAQRVWDNWQKYDWANRTVEEHFPLSYPEFVTGAGG